MINIIEHAGGFQWQDAEVQSMARGSTPDPTHLVYDEDAFFANLDAGRLEGQFCKVEIYTADGIRYVYVVAPFRFTLIDEVVATVAVRLAGQNIGLVQWQPGSIDRLAAARRARNETGNPHAAARVWARGAALNDAGW